MAILGNLMVSGQANISTLSVDTMVINGATVKGVANNLTTTSEGYVLDARAINDSGWKNLSPMSGVSNYNSSTQPIRYRKIGSMIEVSGDLKPTSDVASQGTLNLFTLPSGCRPSGVIRIIQQGSSTHTWMLSIGTDGVATMQRYRNGGSYMTCSSGAWLPVHIMFFTA